MRRFAKMVVAGVLLAALSASVAMADYNKGFKYYQKYVKKASGIKGSEFPKLLGVQTPEQLEALFKDNAKPLIEKLEKFADNIKNLELVFSEAGKQVWDFEINEKLNEKNFRIFENTRRA